MTINLEKELLKQNRKIVSARELLFIREYERHSSVVDNDALQRVGMTQSLEEGKYNKERVDRNIKQTAKFNQERVFHISQIKSICDKYYLRFLGSSLFKGTIDPELAIKISTFEIAHNVKCQSSRHHTSWTGTVAQGNCYIMAPAESFDLQAKPKDPLFFYKINEEYFYLIHKWGNDLSVFRRVLSALSMPMLPQILAIVVSVVVALQMGQGWLSAVVGLLAALSMTLVMLIAEVIRAINTGDMSGPYPHLFIRQNEWDSPFKDS